MRRQLLTAVAAIALAVTSLACGSTTTAPGVTSAVNADGFAVLGPGGSSLKAVAPSLSAPANNASVTTLSPTFVVAGGALTYSTIQPQYRVRVIDDRGTIAVDSGLMTGTTWTVPVPLTPTSVYTWMARSESRGLTGPWSATSKFTTPVAPGNDYGAWEATCQGKIGEALVVCVWGFVRPTNSVQDLEVVKRVAWLLRSTGAGLLLKSSGENTVPWLGFTFSASRICFPDGHIYKIFSDAGPGGAKTPIYSDNDFVEVANYFPARDPRLR